MTIKYEWRFLGDLRDTPLVSLELATRNSVCYLTPLHLQQISKIVDKNSM